MEEAGEDASSRCLQDLTPQDGGLMTNSPHMGLWHVKTALGRLAFLPTLSPLSPPIPSPWLAASVYIYSA